MSTSHRHSSDEGVDDLKGQARLAAGGWMVAWESETLSTKQRKRFWEYVVEYETAPKTTHFEQLVATGLALPEPHVLSDEELSSKLWEVIRGLARLRAFLTLTNHLSDRELYTVLWHDVLRYRVPALAISQGGTHHVDLVGSGSDTDTNLYLKYYADQTSRQEWLTQFPESDLPAHESAAHQRDDQLPQPDDQPVSCIS